MNFFQWLEMQEEWKSFIIRQFRIIQSAEGNGLLQTCTVCYTGS